MTIKILDVCAFLEEFAPLELAEDWDNVGLLVGDRTRPVERVMTCLTVTPASTREAIEKRADLVIAHHPLPFRPARRLTTDSTAGSLLLSLIEARAAVYSPHTAFDSAPGGINQLWSEMLGLEGVRVLSPGDGGESDQGAGRYGDLPASEKLADVAEKLKEQLGIQQLRAVGDPAQSVCRIAVACGSGGQLLGDAGRADCDLLITGETNFHTCLEAQALGIGLLLPGHYASERFGVERLAELVGQRFEAFEVWASEAEQDPLVWV